MSALSDLAARAQMVGRSEADKTLAATMANGPEPARRQTLRRHQDLLDQCSKTLAQPIACRAGCSFCCYIRVSATAVEVFGLIDYLKHTLSSDAWAKFLLRTESTAHRVKLMTFEQHLVTNVACPVLLEGRCSGYAARPLRCRSHHSFAVADCQEAYDNPSNDLVRRDGTIKMLTDAMTTGFEIAQEKAGYDARGYELSTALFEAATDPAARDRYLNRQQAFLTAVFDVRSEE